MRNEYVSVLWRKKFELWGGGKKICEAWWSRGGSFWPPEFLGKYGPVMCVPFFLFFFLCLLLCVSSVVCLVSWVACLCCLRPCFLIITCLLCLHLSPLVLSRTHTLTSSCVSALFLCASTTNTNSVATAASISAAFLCVFSLSFVVSSFFWYLL